MAVTYEYFGAGYGVAMTASVSAHTKGAYAELDAASAAAADGFYAVGVSGGTVGSAFLMDFATGAAASEVVQIANMLYQCSDDVKLVASDIFVPFAIAAGTRTAGRVQCSTGSRALTVAFTLVAGDASNIVDSGIAYTYGAITATSRGTSIDPGAVANTYGSYVELTAATSTTDPLRWLVAMLGNQMNATPSSAATILEIATGAGGAEVVIVPGLIFRTLELNDDGFVPSAFGRPVNIANGTRIAAHAKCNITDATDRLFDLVIVGIEGDLPVGFGGGGAARVVGGGMVGR